MAISTIRPVNNMDMRWVAGIGLAVVIFFSGYHLGEKNVQQAWDKQTALANEAIAQSVTKQAERSNQITGDYVKGVSTREAINTPVINEINNEIKKPVYTTCKPDANSLRSLNALVTSRSH